MKKMNEVENLSLYAIEIGGRPSRASGRSLIEQHDILFLIGPHFLSKKEFLDYFWPDIKNYWREASDTLHVDSFIELKTVDDYKISIEKINEGKDGNGFDLFFIAAGGYKEGVFGEQHEYIFTVAASKNEAKKKIKENHPFLNQGVRGDKNGPNPHIDSHHSLSSVNIHELLNIGEILRHKGLSITCVPLEKREIEEPNRIIHLGFGRGKD